MKKKLSTGCNFTQTPSLKKQEGKREGSPGIWRVVCVSIVWSEPQWLDSHWAEIRMPPGWLN